MEIALIDNNQLILGPFSYNMRMINSELEDLELSDVVGPQSYNDMPIHFSDGLTHLLPIEKNTEPFDSRYYNIGDFTWAIERQNGIPIKVLFTYPLIAKTLEEVKLEKKKDATLIRKQKESTIIEVTINGSQVEVSTNRDERQLLASKLSASPGLHNFKFRNTWLEITSQELQYVISEVDNYVQSVFDWEHSKHQEIDSCLTIDEVYNINLKSQDEII